MDFALDNITSLLLAISIAFTHLSVVYLAKIDNDKQKIITSIGGGISIAYIFLHLMPELALKGKHNTESLKISSEFLEVSFFFVALLGLLILFVVDALSETSKILMPRKRSSLTSSPTPWSPQSTRPRDCSTDIIRRWPTSETSP